MNYTFAFSDQAGFSVDNNLDVEFTSLEEAIASAKEALIEVAKEVLGDVPELTVVIRDETGPKIRLSLCISTTKLGGAE